MNGHDARETAVNAAEPWLRAWSRFERTFAEQAAAFDAPEAPVRIARGRALLDAPGLPLPFERRIAAIVDAHDAHRAGRMREAARRGPQTDVLARLAQYQLEAAREQARRDTAEALRASDALRRGLARHSRDATALGASVEQCHELADDARGLAPALPPSEASTLFESVRDAARRLWRRLADARRRLQSVRGRFDRAWANERHAKLRAGWDAHRASEDFHPEHTERHRPWIGVFRDLVRDPHLDPDRREDLATVLHEYDTVWPRQRARYVETVGRWNALVANARDGFINEAPGYGALIEELRAMADFDPLTKGERESLHAALREHDEHRKHSRYWSRGISM